jgi:type IV pilus assembly protein PilE
MRTIKRGGFSLLELMVAVAVVSVLAAFALPSYEESLRKSRRADARILLTDTALRFEQCHAECLSYTEACRPGCPPALPRTSTGGQYEIGVSGGSVIGPHAFTLVARPVVGKAQIRDRKCQSFSLAHSGARSASGNGAGDCWN